MATNGSVVFTDERTEVQIALTAELPDEAFGALLSVDLEKVEGERVSWEDERQAWYSLRGERCPVKLREHEGVYAGEARDGADPDR